MTADCAAWREAIDITRYITELNDTKQNLAAECKLVSCIENLVMSTDFDVAVNSMLETIIEHYDADRAYIFEFDWMHDVTHNTFEICRDGVAPQKAESAKPADRGSGRLG